MSEEQKSGAPFNCSTAIVFLVIVFICGCISIYYVPQLRPDVPAAPTWTPRPASSPTPPAIVWTLEAPEGLTHALFTDECLIDEECWDCIIGDLIGGTQLSPTPDSCEQAQWDPTFVYCHVRVLDGELRGETGWVNERFIRRR